MDRIWIKCKQIVNAKEAPVLPGALSARMPLYLKVRKCLVCCLPSRRSVWNISSIFGKIVIHIYYDLSFGDGHKPQFIKKRERIPQAIVPAFTGFMFFSHHRFNVLFRHYFSPKSVFLLLYHHFNVKSTSCSITPPGTRTGRSFPPWITNPSLKSSNR